jgi:hypothetical protein
LFSRNKDRAAENLQWAQDAAYTVLAAQIALGAARDGGTNQKRLATPYAVGYVFGFADALLRQAVHTDDVQMAALTFVHTRLFGVTQGSKIFGASLRQQINPHRIDPHFDAGCTDGGSEAIAFIAGNAKSVPTGLADYLNARPRS